jgi:hypothetical protein
MFNVGARIYNNNHMYLSADEFNVFVLLKRGSPVPAQVKGLTKSSTDIKRFSFTLVS